MRQITSAGLIKSQVKSLLVLSGSNSLGFGPGVQAMDLFLCICLNFMYFTLLYSLFLEVAFSLLKVYPCIFSFALYLFPVTCFTTLCCLSDKG